jgi:hypothetical protein
MNNMSKMVLAAMVDVTMWSKSTRKIMTMMIRIAADNMTSGGT